MIGDDCIILDGSVLADGVVLLPGAVVFPRGMLEANTVYAGAPARPQGPADGALRDRLRQAIINAARSDRIPAAMGSVATYSDSRVALMLAGELRKPWR